jgi:hypothetical protein
MSKPINVWVIQGPKNSQLVLCCFTCLKEALEVLDVEGLADVARAEVKPGTAACMHCACCGFSFYTARQCTLHHDGCPEWSWSASTVMTKLFMEAWNEDFAEDPDPRAWRIAEHVISANPDLTNEQLVTVVVGLMD